MEEPEQWSAEAKRRLGKAIFKARGNMPGRPSQVIASKAAGIGETTWGALETGRDRAHQTSTLRAVENYLGWAAGTADRILRGEDQNSDDGDISEELAKVWERIRAQDQRQDRIESKLDKLLDAVRGIDHDAPADN